MRTLAPALRRTTNQRLAAYQPGWGSLLIAVAATSVATFLALPWSLEAKSLAVVHGLCAQQPSHSIYFGATRLPFDARMTGIYGGVACAAATFLARGRWRYGGVPPLRVVATLVAFVVLLAVDGVNSFLLDANTPHLYTPTNWLRLTSGLLTGLTLAIFIWLLVAQVGFARSAATRRPVIGSLRELGPPLGVAALFALLVLSGWSPLLAPITLVLVATAVAVVSGLALAFVLLASKRESRAATTRDLAGPTLAALAIGVGIIALAASSRFLLEAALHLPPPT